MLACMTMGFLNRTVTTHDYYTTPSILEIVVCVYSSRRVTVTENRICTNMHIHNTENVLSYIQMS